MAAIINKLDNMTVTQIGENGHFEYSWSNSISEQILQLSFQLTRTNDIKVINNLELKLENILNHLNYGLNSVNLVERQISKGYLSILYKIIGHTRDIVEGKGEYTLTYMMIYTWYKFYPNLAFFALKCLVTQELNSIIPYGSWKDIKYFCHYCINVKKMSVNDNLIEYALKLLNDQLDKDYMNLFKNLHEHNINVSLAAKWAPREKTKFGYLYEKLACNYFNSYILSSNENSRSKAVLKCKTEYRKLLSSINNYIDTLQIKQCNQKWREIDFNKVTSITLTKQKKAFLNIKKYGEERYPDKEDRIVCSAHFKEHIQNALDNKENTTIKGKRVGLNDFTKQALNILSQGYCNNCHLMSDELKAEYDLLNLQWLNNSTQNDLLGKMIAMVDVSGSMEGEPMNAAIALGIRIAEKSILGKRVLTFSSKPKWVNLESYTNFISQVKVIKQSEWGTNTNFYAALDMILNAIVEIKMPAEDVQDLVLVILSDMQIDQADENNTESLYDSIKAKYEEAGLRSIGKPYKPPNILFWNLRSTNSFPSLHNQPNASMMSGFSPYLLNIFCEQGLNALNSCTPWSLLEKSLSNDRYKIMEKYINDFLII
jgi:uncharacterized protein with von Willebrand factor type A (vWA) domain